MSAALCPHGRSADHCIDCIKARRFREQVVDQLLNETLHPCPKCGAGDAEFMGSTPRSLGGDGLTGRRCRACGHRWRA